MSSLKFKHNAEQDSFNSLKKEFRSEDVALSLILNSLKLERSID